MKITIDTKEDSKEEIKKVISLLQNMLDEPRSNIFEGKTQETGIFNIFNKEQKQAEDIKTDDLLKEADDIEEKEIGVSEKPKIETY